MATPTQPVARSVVCNRTVHCGQLPSFSKKAHCRRSPGKRNDVALQESATTMTCPRSAQCHIALLGLRKPSENSSRLTELPKSPSIFVTKMYRLVHQLEVEDTPCGTLHKEWGLSPPGGHCGVVDAGMLFCRGPFWLRVREGRENTPDFNVI